MKTYFRSKLKELRFPKKKTDSEKGATDCGFENGKLEGHFCKRNRRRGINNRRPLDQLWTVGIRSGGGVVAGDEPRRWRMTRKNREPTGVRESGDLDHG